MTAKRLVSLEEVFRRHGVPNLEFKKRVYGQEDTVEVSSLCLDNNGRVYQSSKEITQREIERQLQKNIDEAHRDVLNYRKFKEDYKAWEKKNEKCLNKIVFGYAVNY